MISVLMPVKNASDYLEECLLSVLSQTFENWELIAVDDHSTDNSAEILHKYAELDNRIKPVQNKETGIISALSTAYSLSIGNSISRMDADDIMLPHKLETLFSALEEQPESVVTSYVEYFSEHSLGSGYRKYEQWLNALVDQRNHYDHIYKECVLPSPNWLMKRSILDKIGGFDSLTYPEDYDLAFRLYANSIPLIGINEVLHKWRDYPERTSRNDPNYQDNAFIPLKVHHFLDIDYNNDNLLVLWGAGKKGKAISRLLAEHNTPYKWVTNNPRKAGLQIDDVTLEPDEIAGLAQNAQVIIAVAGPEDQIAIKNRLERRPDLDVYWFC
ncbi:MAG: glycosyltransferase [Crocinitomicaceae bacterium]|nr:glycosyltransferase [Crocinitomicaceae bacterium]